MVVLLRSKTETVKHKQRIGVQTDLEQLLDKGSIFGFPDRDLEMVCSKSEFGDFNLEPSKW